MDYEEFSENPLPIPLDFRSTIGTNWIGHTKLTTAPNTVLVEPVSWKSEFANYRYPVW